MFVRKNIWEYVNLKKKREIEKALLVIVINDNDSKLRRANVLIGIVEKI